MLIMGACIMVAAWISLTHSFFMVDISNEDDWYDGFEFLVIMWIGFVIQIIGSIWGI